MVGSTSNRRTKSDSSFERPSVRRKPPMAHSGESPIASNTNEGVGSPSLQAAPELAACFALGHSVIVALDATRAVCLDRVGIANPASPAFRRLLGAMKK